MYWSGWRRCQASAFSNLGCGTGRLTAELVSSIGEGTIVAVDRSEAMLREATAVKAGARGPHLVGDDTPSSVVHFVQADGACLPFADAFDAVLSTATFHWIRDHDALFASIYRALVPGGRLVAQCGGGPNLERLLDRADGAHAPRAVRPLLRRLARSLGVRRRPDDDGAASIDAAFTAVDVYLEEAPTTLPDRAAFRDFLSCVCIREHLARLPQTERDLFLDRLADQSAHDDPPFTLDYWRLNIIARKPAGIEQAA